MQSLRRIFPKCFTAYVVRSSGPLQLKTASSSASIADQVQDSFLSQLCDQLASSHIRARDIKKTVQLNPNLLKYPPSQWCSLYNTLTNFGFEGTEFLGMVETCPSLLSTDLKGITQVWEALTVFRLNSSVLAETVARKPYLLCNSPQSAEAKVHAILNFVGFKNNSWQVINNCDNIFALPLAELKNVIDYVHDVMKVKRKHEICRSRVVECPFEKLKMRHTFLVECGRYTPVVHDTPTIIPHSNPLLYLIVDTSDESFATRAAKVTPEEYAVYKDLWEKRKSEDIYDYSDDDD